MRLKGMNERLCMWRAVTTVSTQMSSPDRVVIGRNNYNNIVCVNGGALIGRYDHATVELEHGHPTTIERCLH